MTDTLDFWCPKDGIDHGNCVLIQIPKICCGEESIINYVGSDENATMFKSACKKHLMTYKMIWNNFGPKADSKTEIAEIKYGHICSGPCGEYNQYAEPNQKDGTFICWSCRTRS